MSDITIRKATADDAEQITEIVNHYILHTVLTFVTEPKTTTEVDAQRQRIQEGGFPFIVAEDRATKALAGYSYVSQFRDGKPAYAHSLELCLFCHPNHVRRGIGGRLLERMTCILRDPQICADWLVGDRLLRCPSHQLLAVMAVDAEGPGSGLSLRDWYVQHGFEQVGHLKKVGWKKERWVDVLFLQMETTG